MDTPTSQIFFGSDKLFQIILYKVIRPDRNFSLTGALRTQARNLVTHAAAALVQPSLARKQYHLQKAASAFSATFAIIGALSEEGDIDSRLLSKLRHEQHYLQKLFTEYSLDQETTAT